MAGAITLRPEQLAPGILQHVVELHHQHEEEQQPRVLPESLTSGNFCGKLNRAGAWLRQ